jgi:acyl-CoA dehydrogenase
MTVLTLERNGAAGGETDVKRGVRDLIAKAAASGRLDSAAARSQLARWWVEEQGVRRFGERIGAAVARGESPPVALVKLVSAARTQQMNAFHMDVDEYDGLFLGDDKPEQEDVFFQYVWAAALRIAGGADEILRNQLAERALGMPAEPRMDKVPFNQLPGVT